MSMKYNYKIEYNHTFKEYLKNVKFFKRHHLKITLEEAQAFDKKFNSYSYDENSKKYIYQYRILNNNTWWFIDDVFYEVPARFIKK